ncbi:hypothetical protein K440DRAFT_657862 [Wilcoxina mikolae CBS 423.85]|nr:hypothetical protein K440DRAFT_657862 [Wilcoxina mikolae CBS 423.85]
MGRFDIVLGLAFSIFMPTAMLRMTSYLARDYTQDNQGGCPSLHDTTSVASPHRQFRLHFIAHYVQTLLLKRALRGPLRLSASRSIQAPFSGPPSYDTIAQRFSSSQPNPLYFFSEKRQQESLYTEILHDIIPEIGFYPSQYDVMLTDISHETLKQRISDELGIVYLSEATDDAKKPELASKKFGLDPDVDAAALATIGGYQSPVRTSPSSSHFPDVNVLGYRFL